MPSSSLRQRSSPVYVCAYFPLSPLSSVIRFSRALRHIIIIIIVSPPQTQTLNTDAHTTTASPAVDAAPVHHPSPDTHTFQNPATDRNGTQNPSRDSDELFKIQQETAMSYSKSSKRERNELLKIQQESLEESVRNPILNKADQQFKNCVLFYNNEEANTTCLTRNKRAISWCGGGRVVR